MGQQRQSRSCAGFQPALAPLGKRTAPRETPVEVSLRDVVKFLTRHVGHVERNFREVARNHFRGVLTHRQCRRANHVWPLRITPPAINATPTTFCHVNDSPSSTPLSSKTKANAK